MTKHLLEIQQIKEYMNWYKSNINKNFSIIMKHEEQYTQTFIDLKKRLPYQTTQQLHNQTTPIRIELINTNEAVLNSPEIKAALIKITEGFIVTPQTKTTVTKDGFTGEEDLINGRYEDFNIEDMTQRATEMDPNEGSFAEDTMLNILIDDLKENKGLHITADLLREAFSSTDYNKMDCVDHLNPGIQALVKAKVIKYSGGGLREAVQNPTPFSKIYLRTKKDKELIIPQFINMKLIDDEIWAPMLAEVNETLKDLATSMEKTPIIKQTIDKKLEEMNGTEYTISYRLNNLFEIKALLTESLILNDKKHTSSAIIEEILLKISEKIELLQDTKFEIHQFVDSLKLNPIPAKYLEEFKEKFSDTIISDLYTETNTLSGASVKTKIRINAKTKSNSDLNETISAPTATAKYKLL